MRRSILTSFLVVGLCAGSFTFAAAEETVPAPAATAGAASVPDAPRAAPIQPDAAATDTVASAGAPAADTRPAETPPAAGSDDAALPTAGADLSMWNAPADGAATASGAPLKSVSRLRRFASGIINRSSMIASSLTRSAMRFLGTPYVFGGSRPGGFDCSGYVQHVFAMIGLHLPRTADAQYDAGHRIAAMAPGDLVFFHTYAPGVSHVGIYLGNDKFIHSSSSHGVSIASLHNSYWAPRYLGAKRVVGY